MDHICCRAVSSQEDHPWKLFLNEANIEEVKIEKHQSAEANPQLSENHKAKETNADVHQERDEEAILEAESDQGELIRWHL